MSNADPEGRVTKNQRRDAAREKARQLREEQQRKAKRNKIFVRGGILIGVLGVAAVITLIVVNSIRPPGPFPANMASDGLVVGAGAVAEPTPALDGTEAPIATTPSEDPNVVDIQLFVDYLCPFCGQFEENYGATLDGWLTEGSIRLEIHPVATLNNLSLGTQYSARSANAFACVANYSPDNAWAFHQALFVDQPAEQTEGLSDAELIERIASVGVERQSEIENCVTGGTYRSWVAAATARALSADPLPGTEDATFTGTPTVIVNGVKWDGTIALPQFVQQIQGEALAENGDGTEG